MIDWHMSAALENVPRGENALPEVTSLERAVRDWTVLAPDIQATALLTPESAVAIGDAEPATTFAGKAIQTLAERLPG